MKVLLPVLLLALFLPRASAQYWADAGFVIDNIGAIGALYVDSSDNTLYCTGTLIQDWAQPEQSFRYAALQNGAWTLGPPMNGPVRSIMRYHDTLFVAGDFDQVNGAFTSSLAYRANGAWHSAGVFDYGVVTLKVIDNELYALGTFTTVNGEPCKGLVRRAGNGWECMGLDCNTCFAYDLVKYQGHLVVSGTLTWPGYQHIRQLVDGVWLPVGAGILGGLSAGGPLAVYQGDLYLGGLIMQNAGNPGHALMRWDGAAWHQVGQGLQDASGTSSLSFNVEALLVHDDKLFCTGFFAYAGYVPADHIATWDGTQWCSVGGVFGESVPTAMAVYNDTLYIGCGLQSVVDGQFINGVAKFIAPAYENNCSGITAIPDAEGIVKEQLVDLGGGQFMMRGQAAKGILKLFGPMGQIVAERSITAGTSFNLGTLSAGLYLARLPEGKVQRIVVE